MQQPAPLIPSGTAVAPQPPPSSSRYVPPHGNMSMPPPPTNYNGMWPSCTPPATPSPTFMNAPTYINAVVCQSAPTVNRQQMPLRAQSAMSNASQQQGGGGGRYQQQHVMQQHGGGGGHGGQMQYNPSGPQRVLSNDKLLERYRVYLERNGVTQALTDCLITLFETHDKEAGNTQRAGMTDVVWPVDPVAFLASHLGAASNDAVDAHQHRAEITAMQQQMDRVLVENGNLRATINELNADQVQKQMAALKAISSTDNKQEIGSVVKIEQELLYEEEDKENVNVFAPVNAKKAKKSPMAPSFQQSRSAKKRHGGVRK